LNAATPALQARPDGGAEGLRFSAKTIALAKGAGLVLSITTGDLQNELSITGKATLETYRWLLAGALYFTPRLYPRRLRDSL